MAGMVEMNNDRRIVTLEWYEVELAVFIGKTRFVEALKTGRFKPTFREGDPALNDIEAAGAEMAVAKHCGRYWTAYVGGNGRNVADVSPNIEVRRATSSTGPLIIRPGDHVASPYVLVRGSMPNYEIVGWIRGGDGMRDEWRSNPGGKGEMFEVPDMALVVNSGTIFRGNNA